METQQNSVSSSVAPILAPVPAPVTNTSGQYKEIVVPPEIKKWSWGAFFLNWIWGLGNNTYIALLCFIPFVNIIMIFVLGAKGNEWAWKHRHWESVERFKKVQRKWAVAGLIVWVISFSGIGFGIYAAIHTLSLGTKSADTFFADMSSGQVEDAYNNTAAIFKENNSLSDFESAISGDPILTEVKDESFDQQDFSNNEATLKGTLTGDDGTVVPVTVYELKEDGQWKVSGIHIGQQNTVREN